jgi:hypothetical protein
LNSERVIEIKKNSSHQLLMALRDGYMENYRELEVDIGGTKYIIASDDDFLEYIRNGFEPN